MPNITAGYPATRPRNLSAPLNRRSIYSITSTKTLSTAFQHFFAFFFKKIKKNFLMARRAFSSPAGAFRGAQAFSTYPYLKKMSIGRIA
jgi:hypothetical protein